MKKLPFVVALDLADPVIAAITIEQLSLPTPCSGWNVQALLNHIYNELAWVPELLAGKTIAQVGDALDGDLIGTDLHRSWRAYSDTARKSAEQTPPQAVVYLSRRNVPATAYLDEMTGEIIIHTWDLARGINFPFHIPEDIARALYITSQVKVKAWRGMGVIGPEVVVPEGASHETKLLGLFGRQS